MKEISCKELKCQKLEKSIHAKFLKNKLENTFIVISKTIEEDEPINIESFVFDKKNGQWLQNSFSKMFNKSVGKTLSLLDNEDNKSLNYLY